MDIDGQSHQGNFTGNDEAFHEIWEFLRNDPKPAEFATLAQFFSIFKQNSVDALLRGRKAPR